MNSKNILFVGDLRPASNYGAIATTENLIKMVESVVDKKNIKYIDHRSFRMATPIGGWDKVFEIKESSKIKEFVKENIPYSKMVWDKMKKLNSRDDKYVEMHVPYKFELYKEYSKKVLEGKILQYEYNLLKWSDIVYINSEGNIVHGTDRFGRYRIGGLYLLFIAYFAKKYLNKKVCIVNHTVDPGNRDIYDIIKKIYPILDYVYVRETLSLKKLNELGVKNAVFVPDALFSYEAFKKWSPSERLSKQIDFSRPFICLGDSSGNSKVKWNIVSFYSKLIKALKRIVPQIIFVDGFNEDNEDINKIVMDNKIGRVNLQNCNYNDLYEVLKRAEIFISGRWHASILSVLSGTPILLWGADSHKTESLYVLLEYPYRFFDNKTLPIHIDDISNETIKILNNKDEVKKSLKQKVEIYRNKSYENIKCLKEEKFYTK